MDLGGLGRIEMDWVELIHSNSTQSIQIHPNPSEFIQIHFQIHPNWIGMDKVEGKTYCNSEYILYMTLGRKVPLQNM